MRQQSIAFSLTLLLHYTQSLNLVVISPAGGVGEAAAVSAAKRGNNVNWFVLQQQGRDDKISLSEEVFGEIRSAGGSVEVAGSSVESILDGGSARSAVSKWCSMVKPDAMICTADAFTGDDVYRAICIAAQEACKVADQSCSKLAIVSHGKNDKMNVGGDNENKGLLGGIFAGSDQGDGIPNSLTQALGSNTMELQYGELFGVPGAPAFVGGPRRDPILREEYIMQAVRIDPSSVIVGNDNSIRSSRLTIGEAAALMVTNDACKNVGIPLFLSSLRGESLSDGEWETEFERALSSTSNSGVLFEAEFSSVPSIRRLSDWLATKWFPAILKTFELATIKTGARPVYATVAEDGKVEIVWQQLKDFKSSNVGKLIIEINDNGLLARREVNVEGLQELPSERVIVRRLADATAQAIEKGLAVKPAVETKQPLEIPVTPVAVSTVAKPSLAATVITNNDAAGPRAAGARRSSQRARGRAKTDQEESENSNDNDASWQ